MKVCYKILIQTYLFVTLMMVLFLGVVFCFFSESTELSNFVTTGSVDISIDNINLENNNFKTAKLSFNNLRENEVINGGLLGLNTITSFKFVIKNKGNSAIKYNLSLGIAFDKQLSEAGKILIYPYSMSNEDIYEEIKSLFFDNAIIGANVSDLKEVQTSSGPKFGIMEQIDSKVLESTFLKLNVTKTAYKEYQYKLVFYEDEEILQQPDRFEGINLELSIVADADINGIKSNWQKEEKSFLQFACTTDLNRPIIEEISGAKMFFISQTENLKLSDYTKAYDIYDGEITDEIVISSVPAFNPKKAGTYKIIYNVKNSRGVAATPLEISIIIWDFTKIVSGNYHTLALTSHGKVYSWGYNIYGQLGDGTLNYSSSPKLVQGLENIIDVAASYGSSYALDASGQTYAWGRNDDGRLGDGTTTTRYTPVMVSQPAGVKFIQISARFHNAGGITAEGDVYTWGYGGYGALGTGGSTDNYKPTKIALSNIVQLEMGFYNGAAITKDGVVYTWGDNLHGQLGTGKAMAVSTNSPEMVSYFASQQIKITSISVGWYHMIAVTEDGKVYTWGYGAEGRLGNALTQDKNVPQLIAISAVASKVVAGYFHSTIMTTSGSVYFFGQNAYGKLGLGNSTNQLTPTLLSTVTNIKDVSLAYDSSFVLTDSGDVYGMGYGGTGVLGIGNNNNSTIPIKWIFTAPDPS